VKINLETAWASNTLRKNSTHFGALNHYSASACFPSILEDYSNRKISNKPYQQAKVNWRWIANHWSENINFNNPESRLKWMSGKTRMKYTCVQVFDVKCVPLEFKRSVVQATPITNRLHKKQSGLLLFCKTKRKKERTANYSGEDLGESV
jgi:hypothetical protein